MKKLLLSFVLSAFFPLVMAQAGVKHETESGMLYSVAVFGTAGYSITDKPYRYSRTTEHGGFGQLSRIGAQVEVDFSPRLSFTMQGEFAPSTHKDRRYHPRLSWAFLTFRPNNNWMLRLGKVRVPLMMNAENMPVGLTYVQSQLPLEIYNIVPVYDITGGILSYTWNLPKNQALTWEGYAGVTRSYFRIFFRGGFPNDPFPENTAYYLPIKANVFGTSLLWQDFENDRHARVKLFYGPVKKRKSAGGDLHIWAKEPTRYEYAPGRFSYLPVAGLNGGTAYDRLRLLFLTLSVNWNLGNDLYFVGEAVHSASLNTTMGLDATALYLMICKRLGKWSPYVSIAGIQPSSKVRHYLKDMANPTGNLFYDKMNMTAADNMVAMQQWSFALGTAYDITPHQRIKLAWMHSKIGNASTMISANWNQNFKHKSVNMFSISYNFLFNF